MKTCRKKVEEFGAATFTSELIGKRMRFVFDQEKVKGFFEVEERERELVITKKRNELVFRRVVARYPLPSEGIYHYCFKIGLLNQTEP